MPSTTGQPRHDAPTKGNPARPRTRSAGPTGTTRTLAWHALLWSLLLAPIGLVLAIIDIARAHRDGAPTATAARIALVNSTLGLATLALLAAATCFILTWAAPSLDLR